MIGISDLVPATLAFCLMLFVICIAALRVALISLGAPAGHSIGTGKP